MAGTLFLSQNNLLEHVIIFIMNDKTRNRKACRDDYVHNVHTAGLHTSDRLLLEAVREVNLFDHAGIRTGDPRSDRRQVQDFTTELRVLE